MQLTLEIDYDPTINVTVIGLTIIILILTHSMAVIQPSFVPTRWNMHLEIQWIHVGHYFPLLLFLLKIANSVTKITIVPHGGIPK